MPGFCMPGHIIMLHLQHSKHLPKLKENVQLVYVVTDADCDSQRLF